MDPRLTDAIAAELQWVIGSKLTPEEMEDVVLSHILTLLSHSEDAIGHLVPRASDPRVAFRSAS